MSCTGCTVRLICVFGIFSSTATGSQLTESTEKSVWKNAYKKCPTGKLGNPSEIEISDTAWQSLKLDEPMWIAGYQKKSKFYWLLGCYSSVTVQTSLVFPDGLSFQRCSEFCGNKTKYVALQKTNCSCATAVSGVNNGKCTLRCSGSSQDFCGGDNYYTVHKKWLTSETRILGDIKLAENTDFDCISVGKYPTGPTDDKLGWLFEDCSQNLETLCQVNRTYLKTVEGKGNRLQSTDTCANSNATLPIFTVEDQQNILGLNILVTSRPYWSGLYRSVGNGNTQDFQIPSPKLCLAVTKTDNGTVVKEARKCNEQLRSVCVMPDESAGSGDSEKNETIDENTSTLNEGSRSTSNTGGIVGGIIGGILLVCLIVIVIICIKRRKKAKPEKKTSYRNPHVSYSPPNEQSRESEIVLKDAQALEQSKNPKKPVRRMKSRKEFNDGKSYENIVLTLEDPHVLSEVLSSVDNDTNKPGDNDYDTTQNIRSKAFNNTENVYNTSESEYDVMERCKAPMGSSAIYDVMENCKPAAASASDYDHVDRSRNLNDDDEARTCTN